MAAYRAPLDDILYTLRHTVDLDAVLSLPAYGHVDRETLEAVARAAARLAEEVIAPINADADRVGARLQDDGITLPPGMVEAYREVCVQGWPGLAFPERWGGQGMPELAQAVLSEVSNGGSLAFSMLTTPSRAAAHVLMAHAPDAIRETWLPRLVSGEWTGTIVMTEPHAGSDIGLARTRATKRDDGAYAISGTKIFISFGDHDAVEQIGHIVLARTEGAPAGVRGLSLFLVPKRLVGSDGTPGARNAVRVVRIEEKMGIHGSPTCEVQFDGAEGYLLGEEGRGIQNMFTMINSMRLEVAMEGAGMAGAATVNALHYASERPQGGEAGGGATGTPVPIIAHADVRRMLMTMKALTDGARAVCYEIARLIDISRAHPDPEVQRDAADLVAWLLPIGKAVFTDNAVEVASLGIQVHGGHGYCRDTGAEQILRDVRITPIYEGTNGIQAIDLATRKLAREDGRLFVLFSDLIAADLDRTAGRAEVAAIRAAVEEGLALLQDCTYTMSERLATAPRDALAAATPYMKLAGRVTVGWGLLRLAAVEADDPLVPEKRALARFYAEQVMRDASAWAAQALQGAETLDALTAEQLARW